MCLEHFPNAAAPARGQVTFNSRYDPLGEASPSGEVPLFILDDQARDQAVADWVGASKPKDVWDGAHGLERAGARLDHDRRPSEEDAS